MDWGPTIERAKHVHDAIFKWDRQQAQRQFDRLYKRWAGLAEQEIGRVTGTTLQKQGMRGQMPRMTWKPIIPVGPRRATDMGAHCSSWLDSKLAEARRYFEIGSLEKLRAVDEQLSQQLTGNIQELGFQRHKELVRSWVNCASRC